MPPTDTNARIAREVMGWKVAPVFPLSYSYRNEYGAMMSAPVPDFARSLDACAIAEAEIERRGLWNEYRDALDQILIHIPLDDRPYVADFLIRLTPEQRCEAMLRL